MQLYLTPVPITKLESSQIVAISHGCELTLNCGSCNAVTITTSNDEHFVMWSYMGEINLSQIKEKDG